MRDGWWGGKSQPMNYSLGIPKGLRVVLEERGINTQRMNAEQMREVLRDHPDSKTRSQASSGSCVRRSSILLLCCQSFAAS